MASIIIQSVTLDPLAVGNTSATIYHREIGGIYTNDGAITILPDGMLTVPKTIAGLDASTSYQIKVELSCGTIHEVIKQTSEVCAAPIISTAAIIDTGGNNFTLQLEYPEDYGILETQIYKNNTPGSGGEFIGMWQHDITGTLKYLNNNPALLVSAVTYYVRSRLICKGSTGTWSDFITYSKCVIDVRADFIFDIDQYKIKITQSNTYSSNVLYNVSFEKDGLWIGPFSGTILTGSLSVLITNLSWPRGITTGTMVRIDSCIPAAENNCHFNY